MKKHQKMYRYRTMYKLGKDQKVSQILFGGKEWVPIEELYSNYCRFYYSEKADHEGMRKFDFNGLRKFSFGRMSFKAFKTAIKRLVAEESLLAVEEIPDITIQVRNVV